MGLRTGIGYDGDTHIQRSKSAQPSDARNRVRIYADRIFYSIRAEVSQEKWDRIFKKKGSECDPQDADNTEICDEQH